MANGNGSRSVNRPLSPSLLSPAAPTSGGATTRGSGSSNMGGARMGSMNEGERTHKHAMPGDRVHDAHIKDGAGGMTHLAHAIGHLEGMKKERKDEAPDGTMIKR